MSELMTLELPDDLARRARELATAMNRRVEDVALEWISQAIIEPNVESLSDAEVLAICDAELNTSQQVELSELLAAQREGDLDTAARPRLEQLLTTYRRGLVAKARAWKEAVGRGLRSPLDAHAA